MPMAGLIEKIVLLGTGNVATHLGLALRRSGLEIVQVYGRRRCAAARLGGLLGCAAVSDLKELSSEADLYLMAISDDAIAGLAKAFPFRDKLLAHTSGSIPLDTLAVTGERTAVFYPLQTFTTGRELEMGQVPFCLEASQGDDLHRLQTLAGKLSTNIYHISSAHRRLLHLAAVFACNFSNYMYAVAEDVLASDGLPFDLLRPLITETASKAVAGSPKAVQTGPAIRHNKEVMDKHLEMLEGHPDYQKIYSIVSESIIKTKDND